MRSLRIGIDATCLATRRGYGRFLRELLPPLINNDDTHSYVLFLDHHAEVELPPVSATVLRPRTSTSQADAASAYGSRGLADLFSMGRAVSQANLDLMYFPSVYSYFPVPSRMPIVVGFHDTIPERYGELVFPSFRTRFLWNAKTWLARKQASAIITVSDWSRDSLAEYFHMPAERIYVTTEAPASLFQPTQDREPQRRWFEAMSLPPDAPYLIYVGGFNPHKNLHRLIEAFAELLKGDVENLRLLLVGDYEGDGFYADVPSLRKQIAQAGIEERVVFAGFVADADLRHLYAGATALVLPSLEEGFGLPAVEAAACGTPCVATQRSPLPKLLEGGGLFVDPENSRELMDSLKQITATPELRARLAERALENVRRLSWRATADATRKVFESVVSVAAPSNVASATESAP